MEINHDEYKDLICNSKYARIIFNKHYLKLKDIKISYIKISPFFLLSQQLRK